MRCACAGLRRGVPSWQDIEGYVDPREPLRNEGPFGDHTGYYTLPEPYPVFHVTAITHRKDAVYPATISGAYVKLFLPIASSRRVVVSQMVNS